jgi:hypothetical protein
MLLIGVWFTAVVIVVCCLMAATRNARALGLGNQLSYAALPLRPSYRFLLKVTDNARQDDQVDDQGWGSGLTKSDAENLLDWLEASGRKGKLTFVSGKGFTVR